MDFDSQRLAVIQIGIASMIEEKILAQIKNSTDKIWVVIDEAQKCPELFEQIKILYDHFKDADRIKFILTGSAHLELHQLTAESLAGRIELWHLREFNQQEIMCFLHHQKVPFATAFDAIVEQQSPQMLKAHYAELRPFNKLLTEALELSLIWGGLPEVLQEHETQSRLRYLDNYLQTYLEKDIRGLTTISDLMTYRNLMKMAAEQTGSIRDDKKITEALGCARNTLHKYRGYLQATLQYTEIYPYIQSSVKRLVKSPKGYLTNNGLLSYFTGIYDKSILTTTGLLGHRFENWFLNELQVWLDSRSDFQQISYWRTNTGVEVDFILQFADKIIPFEITCSTQKKSQKIRHLQSFMATEPKAKWGLYVYLGELAFDEERQIIFLPWML